MARLRLKAICRLAVFGIMTVMSIPQTLAQEHTWHGGVYVAELQSFCTFKSSPGFIFGGSAGYQYNRLVSFDASAAYGKSAMKARSCCANYWLGEDGVRYNTSVMDMSGVFYSDIRNKVYFCRMQVSADFNLLSFLHKPTRWTAGVAPAISFLYSHRKLCDLNMAKSGGYFCIGASANVGYQLNERISVGAYFGATRPIGPGFDGMERHYHNANVLLETGAKVSFVFNTLRK